MNTELVVIEKSALAGMISDAVADGMRRLRPLIVRAATEFLTEDEAAQLYAVSKPQLRRWRLEGSGPAYREMGRCIAYRKSDLDDFFRRFMVGADEVM